MLRGTITFSGRTLGDVELALNEAKRLLLDEFSCGRDSNEDGSYSFSIEEQESVGDRDEANEQVELA